MEAQDQANSFQGEQAQGAPQSRPLRSMAERQDLLAKAVASEVATSGARVESQIGAMAIMVLGRPVNHLLHFFIGLFTLGIWWFTGWPVVMIFGGERRLVVQVDEYGHILGQKTRRVP